ncbi:hypothetical protein N7539_000861 [Penicillium diatomitis]|uniref:Rhodopsin domain-containing protein n=1 Tax=Penicillium diatomitis TaxID=2819901 RepID=A0A9X0C323_9EURO|nr:uncharacterized protein N7539_000861 [Penicillium diatomitis]KAJ5495745.1 hypothetical protein N7539_000861 [Penicillium diatomitis]
MTMLSTPRGRSALAVSTVFTCLATALTLIRIYTRAFWAKKIGSDDYTVIAALTCSWIFYGLFVGEVYHGMGEHYAKIPHDTYKVQMLCFWASVPLYQSTLVLTKISIVLQYRRVFPSPGMRLACNILLGFLITFALWAVISAWAMCVPLRKFWDPDVVGFCFDKKALWFSNSAIHILTDFMILVWPMPLLKSLQLPKRQRFALMAVFALGIFVTITSALRLRSLLLITLSTDPTYDNVGAAEWSAIECNVAIMCASLPSTRAFFSNLLPHVFSSGSNAYRSRNTRPSRTGHSQLTGTGTMAHSHILSSVVGGLDEGDYDMKMHRLKGPGASAKVVGVGMEKSDLAGIKVTTLVTQELSLEREGVHGHGHDHAHVEVDGDTETGSTRDLVRKGS